MFQQDLFSSNWGVTPPPGFIDFGMIGSAVVATPAPKVEPPKPANPYLFMFTPGNTTPAEVREKWESLPYELRHGNLRFTFDRMVCMWTSSKHVSKMKSRHVYRLFIGKGDILGYTNKKRSGWIFDQELAGRLVSIEPVPDTEQIEKVRKLANRIYPGVWDDLKAKLLVNPEEYYRNYGYTVTSIASKFPDYVLEGIRKAFEEKSRYTHDTGGYWKHKKTGRDLKVECKLCDDGIYRAWFSSEFPGCANGDYWLLINPTTAVFKERD